MQGTMLAVHILAGAIALATGFAALFARKGGGLHRKSGLVFVYAMVAMGFLGALIAALRASEASVIGGLLACYLVVTALTTVRPAAAGQRRLDVLLLVVALAVGATSVAWGFDAAAAPQGAKDGIPAVIFFKFGLVALLAAASDVRLLRSGPPAGAKRLARHLWRMCFALYVASASFFLGQADELPEALRIPGLLAIPAFLPLVVMLYWLWRIRRRRESGVLIRVIPRAEREPSLDPAQRLRLLEQSIARQRERERRRPELNEKREGEGRGWTREELYERGRAR